MIIHHYFCFCRKWDFFSIVFIASRNEGGEILFEHTVEEAQMVLNSKEDILESLSYKKNFMTIYFSGKKTVGVTKN